MSKRVGCHAIPDATYRLQFGSHCTFDDAVALVPYLDALGISHVYASPWLKARHDSPHGYDITDHNAFQPAIGDADAFHRFTRALGDHGMGHILDLVSNHMGVGGSDNGWWLDVLEHGPASAHARAFDIDWRPVLERLRGRVLLPFLDDHYGAVLERGDLVLEFDRHEGGLYIGYGDHRFPLDPRTWPVVLRAGSAEVAGALSDIVAELAALPARDDPDPESCARRRRRTEELRQKLVRLYSADPAVARHVDQGVRSLRAEAGGEGVFDRLHRLIELQAWRPAHWRVAADEINYRRFFDINDLAGLRMEEPDLFDRVHALVRRLVAEGALQGLRIDHVDGLYDPGDYTHRLRRFFPGYLVVEKILGPDEPLPADWPVHGTTGYDFAALATGVLVDPAGERPLTRLYHRFVGNRPDFDAILHECRRLVIRNQLAGELTMLANMADAIAQADRHTRDFTLNGLRTAIAELAAALPVYRTYVTPGRVGEQDRRAIDEAGWRAVRRAPAEDAAVYRFLHDLLLFETPSLERHPRLRGEAARFVQRFQQFTPPVMAKALEDTAFYRYNRLVALNEVGSDPRRFGVSLTAFHQANRARLDTFPHTMLCTSTHDTKRSEDVRARLAVLSEMPGEWRRRVFRWSRLARRHKRDVDGVRAPSRNDEYLLYQTLIGAWPAPPAGDLDLAAFADRVVAYMIKAAREAKTDTSWISPNADYEAALEQLVRALLRDSPRNAFLADFLPFQRRVARLGALNGLAQVLLRLTAPGVPDLYQGNELWRFDLVDPDNRRPVDFARRRALLEEIAAAWSAPDAGARIRAMVADPADDRVKLLVSWRTLRWRRSRPALFREGSYQPLWAEGDVADHVCAYARTHGEDWVVAATLRWPGGLVDEGDAVLPAPAAWGDAILELPIQAQGQVIHDVLTGRCFQLGTTRSGRHSIAAADLFALLPVALLAPAEAGARETTQA